MKTFLKNTPYYKLLKQLVWDLQRFLSRRFVKTRYSMLPAGKKKCEKVQFAAGPRYVQGWLNVDISNADLNLDLGYSKFPFTSGSINIIATQHLIEHLEFNHEIYHFLTECFRILKKDGRLYISTPDFNKIAIDYVKTGGSMLFEDRKSRVPSYDIGKAPPVAMLNDLIFQSGQHKCVYDFSLIAHILYEVGFTSVEKISEKKFNEDFPEFVPRKDDLYSLYVVATK
jgi:predicted SAM-dependent methyltransferase